MFKLFLVACFLAVAAAKPGVYYTAPVAAAYTAPVAAAYTAPVAYSAYPAYSAYTAPVAAYSAYTYASPYSYYLRRRYTGDPEHRHAIFESLQGHLRSDVVPAHLTGCAATTSGSGSALTSASHRVPGREAPAPAQQPPSRKTSEAGADYGGGLYHHAFLFACFLAVAAAKPGVYYTAPVAAAYTAPVAAAYTAPVAYSAYPAYSAYTAPSYDIHCYLYILKLHKHIKMFKLFMFACFLALAAAKPGVYYTAPVAAAYTAPVAAAYTAPVAYSAYPAYSAYTAPVAAYSAYTYASPYSYYLRR
ncbi:cuticle protein 18.6-like [Colias croceus]|uniref:cuticle protein 18.6-like n=1 Tax=Colias crocea TaxID=72248 RepID=UPI001E27DEDC|nr:cuticle protein 18.6-like [Colias croceus]